MKYLANKSGLILTLILSLALITTLFSACNLFGEEEEPEGPVTSVIYAPPENVQALAGSPIQIQSAHPNPANIARVELLVSRENEPEARLIRSDVPEGNVVLQEWVPPEAGLYTVRVRAVSRTPDTPATEITRQIRVIDLAGSGVAVAGELQPPVRIAPTVVLAVPPATQTPTVVDDAGAAFVMEVAVQPTPTPTPPRLYPPPPPAPGVPWGPTQAELPNFTAPVCDNAEFIDIFALDRGRRISITEPDQVAARSVAGTTVFRAWRVRNIGTCTWGPGYELAFYGGRTMGSGGVAFEATFPGEPARRNTVVDNNRLIVPEGKPNQTAVLEIQLEVPSIPGIHQSYWRLRNPQGVFFGPIFGVTLEVVRECGFSTPTNRIYGAPVINRFEILGVGNVYRPENPVNVRAKLDEPIWLEWNIINATNFDIVFEDPTGNLRTETTNRTSDRTSFIPETVGPHRITLFADNGVCTAEATVNIEVEPHEGEQFRFNLIFAAGSQISSADAAASFSTAVREGTTQIEWTHFDPDTNRFYLIAETERVVEECPFDWDWACYETTDLQREVVLRLDGRGSEVNRATVANLVSRSCRGASGETVVYYMQAFVDGRPAEPEFSNRIEAFCETGPSSRLPTEIR